MDDERDQIKQDESADQKGEKFFHRQFSFLQLCTDKRDDNNKQDNEKKYASQ